MAYTLQAIVFGEHQPSLSAPGTHTVALGQGLVMLPFSAEFISAQGIPFLPLTDEGSPTLPSSIEKFWSEKSSSGKAAYLEAEFFGGDGVQAFVAFENGSSIGTPIVSESAINQGLRFLGAAAGEALDEFEALGLLRHRDTEGWLKEVAV